MRFVLLVFLFFVISSNIKAQPNILWIVSEDNSPFMGCYGDSLATTPNIDNLANEGILFENAMATAPQCAPARFSIITGVYSNAMGTENMRSTYPIPDFIQFFPEYLREAGFYTSNNSKKDYNTIDQPEAWDESSSRASYKNRTANQPFFSVFNINTSHESSIHKSIPSDSLEHDPNSMILAPYHPDIPEMRHDYAQYYDKIADMDFQVGELIKQLEDDGLLEETIIFYFSDHGGVLGRSKGYLFESGLRVPFVVRIPDKYRYLFPDEWQPGYRSDKPVSFIDLAPTVLDIAGVSIPDYMQGQSILDIEKGRAYNYSFRGRSGETIDLSRSVRSKRYRYTLNLMPHLIYGQYNEYRWRAPSLKAWEEAYINGELNDVQSRFFHKKSFEELYDVIKDPHNIHNLVNDPAFSVVLSEHRNACINWMMDIRDIGFIPEGLLQRYMNLGFIPAEIIQTKSYPYGEILELATSVGAEYNLNTEQYMELLKDDQPEIRYWAATGLLLANIRDVRIIHSLTKMKNDPIGDVKLVIAEVFIQNEFFQDAFDVIHEVLINGNELERVHALQLIEKLSRPMKLKLKKLVISIAEKMNVGYYDGHLANILIENRKIFD